MNNINRNTYLIIMILVIAVVAFYMFSKQKEGLINIEESPTYTPDEINFYINFMLDKRGDVSPEEKAIAKEFLAHYIGYDEGTKVQEKFAQKFAYLHQKYAKMLNDFGFLIPPEKQTEATRQMRQNIERHLKELKQKIENHMQIREMYFSDIQMREKQMKEKQMREIDEMLKKTEREPPTEREIKAKELRDRHIIEQAQMKEQIQMLIKDVQERELRERQIREVQFREIIGRPAAEATMRPSEPPQPTIEMIQMIEMQMKDIQMNWEKYMKEREMKGRELIERQMREIDEIKKISDPKQRDMRERELREIHMKEQVQMRETTEREMRQMSEQKYMKEREMNGMRLVYKQMREIDEIKKISDPKQRDMRERELREIHMKEQAQFRETTEREMRQMSEPMKPSGPLGPTMPAMTQQVMCKADGTWSNNSPVTLGTVITRPCPTGGFQTATCRADGGWDSDGKCSNPSAMQAMRQQVMCKADGTWSNNSPVTLGTVITRPCPTGGFQTATCRADGGWDSDGKCSNPSAMQAMRPAEAAMQAMRPSEAAMQAMRPAEAAMQAMRPAPTPVPVNANPGDAISCIGYNPKGPGAIYRYDGNKAMRHYPNPSIASSWDPNWGSGANRKIDCTGFTLGPDIAKR